MKYNHVVLTGATGVVGQHILFELLSIFSTQPLSGKIHLIVRGTSTQTPEDRIQKLLMSDGTPDYLKIYATEQLLEKIEILDTDLMSPKINRIFSFKKSDNVCVIHCAASTNLMSSEEAEKELKFANYHATLNLLNACSPFASKFTFISTAFSCGMRKGFVDEDYLSYQQDNFRNPYEKNKSLAERELARICAERDLPYQILRPSIVCGRLLDAPLYYTPKFDVFYGYTKFFYKLMDTPFANTALRIAANMDRAVSNVIPVDYVAKAVVRAIDRDDIVQMNIAHSKSVPLTFSLPKMVELNGYGKYKVVNRMPADMNMLEAAYYAELGNISTPYLLDEAFEFDARTVRALLADIPEPDIEANTDPIFEFAKSKQFVNA